MDEVEDDKPVRLTALGLPRKPGKRGGARPGAGRPKKTDPDEPTVIEDDITMLQLLKGIALGRYKVSPMQLTAARAAIQYEQEKAGDGGKGERQQQEAKTTAGSFPQTPAPSHMRAVG